MILQRNKVYTKSDGDRPGERWRILHTSEASVYIISVDTKGEMPIELSAEIVKARRWEETEDPWLNMRATHDDRLPALHRSRRDKARTELQFLFQVASSPAPANGNPRTRLLDSTFRNTRLRAVAKERGLHVNSLRRWLQRWWARGMSRNALLPDMAAMSGAGKSRSLSVDECDSDGNPLDSNLHPKPGRPSGYGTRRGIKMTQMIRTSIETLGAKLYLENTTFSLPDAYAQWKTEEKPIRPRFYPTPKSFAWYLTRVPEVEAAVKDRVVVGRKRRAKDPVRDAMHTRVPGCGFLYQGDSTPLPRITVKGQGITLYFVSDTKCGGIAGYYAYAGHPRADAHSRALANAAEDKVVYCMRHGVSIVDEQWPMSYVPEAWVADRGELIGPIADTRAASYSISPTSSAPACASG